MNNKIHIVVVLFLIILFAACKSSKTDKKMKAELTMNKEIPFTLLKATYQNWYGGVKGVKGIKIVILGKDVRKDIVFKDLYYLDKKASIHTTNKENELVLAVNINTSTRREQLILHNDSQNEYGNKPPVISKFPNLKENEAVITYLQKGETNNFKINLEKGMELLYR